MIAKKENKIIKAKLVRGSDGQVRLYIKTDKKIDEFFKNDTIETSSYWKVRTKEGDEPARYYSLNRSIRVAGIDSYGGSRLETRNISYLRTVGISHGVYFSMSQQVACKSDCVELLNNLASATKTLYQEYIKPITITMEVSQ